ncbi:extracellular solute-binding protein [Thalassotalea sp. 1_MG-2023]|uniref:ABC transporter substrate-binding protein n=1 Tax=Thalassotalea sp. 1_MG-2023 TaxID=3062680 RepID=UPI0026E39252|nr:extracellular solute-binding protein [Thalassotalea sp. 1_MG-2023]MDO6426122.1 extracellular solute-binding protein [Thalassotalea sp. 1_MG-2023]
MKNMITKLMLVCIALITCITSTWAATEINLYTWRRQEVSLWQHISQHNVIPGVTVNVKLLRSASYEPHMLLSLQNNTPDVFQWAPGANSLQKLVKHNFVKPYQGTLTQMNQGALIAALAADNKLYGVPFALQLQSVMVNRKLVNKHGIHQQPKTLSAMEQVFSTLKQAGVTPIQLAGNVNWYLSQLLAEVLLSGLVSENVAENLVSGQACFTDPEYQQVFIRLKQWMDKGFINDNVASESYVGIANSMGLGNSAMTIDGGWRTSSKSDFFKLDNDFQFYFWQIPGAGNKVYALGDGTYQVNANSTKYQAAMKVLNFTATKAFAELFAEHVQELPAFGESVSINNPTLATLSNKVVDAYSVSLFNAYTLNSNEPSYRTLVTQGFKDLFNHQKTPIEITQQIQQGLNSWQYVGINHCQ